MSYKSPINIIESVSNQIKVELDNKIYEAVIKCDIDVDRQELIKALEYDRNQYQQGFKDAQKFYDKALDILAEKCECQSCWCKDCKVRCTDEECYDDWKKECKRRWREHIENECNCN